MSFPRKPHPPTIDSLKTGESVTRHGSDVLTSEAAPMSASDLSPVSGVRSNDDSDRPVRELMVSPPRSSETGHDSPLTAVMKAYGHDRRCRMRVRAGLAVTCQCRTPQPVDDATIAIGLVIRFARIGLSRRLPMPRGIVERLARHVEDGDPASAMVWNWLAQHGLVAGRKRTRKPERPVLRLVCTEES